MTTFRVLSIVFLHMYVDNIDIKRWPSFGHGIPKNDCAALLLVTEYLHIQWIRLID